MNLERALRQLKELDRLGGRMRLAAEEWDTDWKCLIAIMMSAQSRDETTIRIADSLFKKYPTLEKLASAKYEDVLEVFKSLNYNATKAKNVIGCARMLIEEHNGKVPHDIDKLVELPGVGRKTANVFMAEQGKDGLGVDTHVYQIAKKIGWSAANSPDKVEDDLKKLFPREYWNKVNPALVRFGKLHTSRKKKEELLEYIRDM